MNFNCEDVNTSYLGTWSTSLSGLTLTLTIFLLSTRKALKCWPSISDETTYTRTQSSGEQSRIPLLPSLLLGKKSPWKARSRPLLPPLQIKTRRGKQSRPPCLQEPVQTTTDQAEKLLRPERERGRKVAVVPRGDINLERDRQCMAPRACLLTVTFRFFLPTMYRNCPFFVCFRFGSPGSRIDQECPRFSTTAMRSNITNLKRLDCYIVVEVGSTDNGVLLHCKAPALVLTSLDSMWGPTD